MPLAELCDDVIRLFCLLTLSRPGGGGGGGGGILPAATMYLNNFFNICTNTMELISDLDVNMVTNYF